MVKKRKRKLYILLFISIVFLISFHSFSKSYTYVGNMTITKIDKLHDGEFEVYLTSLDTGTVSVKIKEEETIFYRKKNSSDDYVSSKELLEIVSVNEEYLIRIDIYKFPLNLAFKNKINYIKE